MARKKTPPEYGLSPCSDGQLSSSLAYAVATTSGKGEDVQVPLSLLASGTKMAVSGCCRVMASSSPSGTGVLR
jgi:hypothetical protein